MHWYQHSSVGQVGLKVCLLLIKRFTNPSSRLLPPDVHSAENPRENSIDIHMKLIVIFVVLVFCLPEKVYNFIVLHCFGKDCCQPLVCSVRSYGY